MWRVTWSLEDLNLDRVSLSWAWENTNVDAVHFSCNMGKYSTCSKISLGVRLKAHTLFIERVLYFTISHSIEHRLHILSAMTTTHLPTKFSRTLLFPALWLPTTAICGKSKDIGTPDKEKASCNLFTIGMRVSIPKFPDILTLLAHSSCLLSKLRSHQCIKIWRMSIQMQYCACLLGQLSRTYPNIEQSWSVHCLYRPGYISIKIYGRIRHHLIFLGRLDPVIMSIYNMHMISTAQC